MRFKKCLLILFGFLISDFFSSDLCFFTDNFLFFFVVFVFSFVNFL